MEKNKLDGYNWDNVSTSSPEAKQEEVNRLFHELQESLGLLTNAELKISKKFERVEAAQKTAVLVKNVLLHDQVTEDQINFITDNLPTLRVQLDRDLGFAKAHPLIQEIKRILEISD